MNKQELIGRIKRLDESYLKTEFVLKLIEQLDEPKPVKVPQFVAEYIEYAKNNYWDLQDLFKFIDDEENKNLQRWFYHECEQETLALAWLFGYEVEGEKRYFVKMKGIAKYKNYLVFGEISRTWFFASVGSNDVTFTHTSKELEEAGFGWVFDCEGIEVEEVE